MSRSNTFLFHSLSCQDRKLASLISGLDPNCVLFVPGNSGNAEREVSGDNLSRQFLIEAIGPIGVNAMKLQLGHLVANSIILR
jgi:hypothetical protein